MMRGFMFHPKFPRLVVRVVIFRAFYLLVAIRGNFMAKKKLYDLEGVITCQDYWGLVFITRGVCLVLV